MIDTSCTTASCSGEGGGLLSSPSTLHFVSVFTSIDMLLFNTTTARVFRPIQDACETIVNRPVLKNDEKIVRKVCKAKLTYITASLINI